MKDERLKSILPIYTIIRLMQDDIQINALNIIENQLIKFNKELNQKVKLKDDGKVKST